MTCDSLECYYESKRVERRIRRLRALADGYRRLVVASGYIPMFRKQREIERARIVAKARSYADVCERAGADMRWLRAFADEIEGGE